MRLFALCCAAFSMILYRWQNSYANPVNLSMVLPFTFFLMVKFEKIMTWLFPEIPYLSRRASMQRLKNGL